MWSLREDLAPAAGAMTAADGAVVVATVVGADVAATLAGADVVARAVPVVAADVATGGTDAMVKTVKTGCRGAMDVRVVMDVRVGMLRMDGAARPMMACVCREM